MAKKQGLDKYGAPADKSKAPSYKLPKLHVPPAVKKIKMPPGSVSYDQPGIGRDPQADKGRHINVGNPTASSGKPEVIPDSGNNIVRRTE